MRYYYFENLAKQKRRKKVLFRIGLVILGVIAIGVAFVMRDTLSKQQAVSTDSGVIKTITKLDDFKTFDESRYSLQLPSDWERSKNSNTDLITYISGDKTHKALTLDVYMNSAIPADFSTVRALPIEYENGKIVNGLISERCNEFTKPKDGFGENLVSPSQPSVWQGIDFSCNFSKVLNFTATIHKGSGFRTQIAGPTTSVTYLFVYTDHTARPDFSVFYTILSTFTAK